MKLFRNICDKLFFALELLLATVMAGLVLAVIWQVVTRFVMNSPSGWTEEMATMLLIPVTMIGAAVGFRRRVHLGLDYFVGLLPRTPRRIVDILGWVICILFACIVLIYGGLLFALNSKTNGTVSAAMEIPLWINYMSLPVSGAFIVLACVEGLLTDFLKVEPPAEAAAESRTVEIT